MNITLPKELYEKVRFAAREQDKSVSKIVRESFRNFIKKYNKQGEVIPVKDRFFSSEHKKKISSSLTSMKKDFGEGVGYDGIHQWLRRKYGKAIICEVCNSKENVEWANKTGQYRKVRNDFVMLCKKCHSKFDK